MILDEETAKTRWCPFARLPVPGVGAVNRAINHIERDPAGGIIESSIDISLSTCIGSACMAWAAETRLVMNSDKTGYAIPHRREPTGRGACGLVRG